MNESVRYQLIMRAGNKESYWSGLNVGHQCLVRRTWKDINNTCFPPPILPHPSSSKQVALDSPLLLSHVSDAVPDMASDLLLAQMLQLEFDREHDVQVKAEEQHLNKRSKG